MLAARWCDMATTSMVPLEEYLHTTYHPDREWVDGELRERNVGNRAHSVVQKFFMKFFLGLEKELRLLVYSELRTQVSARNFRIPDVLVMREDDPFTPIVQKAPLLCIEILSPDDRMTDVWEKIEEYVAMGVEAVWVIDPQRRRAFVLGEGALLPVTELTVAGTRIVAKSQDVFAELDRLEGRE